jgi:hypothetical protein
LAKYLHIVSAAKLRSWLKGQAGPAWQAPCRKNLQGTCEVFGGLLGPSKRPCEGVAGVMLAVVVVVLLVLGMLRLPDRRCRYSDILLLLLLVLLVLLLLLR